MLHTFWTNLISSIYNPEFYRDVFAGEKKRTGSFVFLFSLIAGVVACYFVYTGVALFRDGVAKLPAYVAEVYPETMVLTVNTAGELSVAGATEPVVIGFGPFGGQDDVAGNVGGDGAVKNLAVIDTLTPYTPAAHKASDSFMWVGKTFLTESGGRDTNRRVYAYVDMMEEEKEPLVVTKTDADKAARAVAGFAGIVVPVAIIATFIFTTLVYMFGMLVFGVIIGGMLWVLANKLQVGVLRKGGADVTYIAAIRAAIFAGVLPSVVMLVSWFTPVTLTYGMYTLATLLIVYINMRSETEKK
jgi:hypothetical protein